MISKRISIGPKAHVDARFNVPIEGFQDLGHFCILVRAMTNRSAGFRYRLDLLALWVVHKGMTGHDNQMTQDRLGSQNPSVR